MGTYRRTSLLVALLAVACSGVPVRPASPPTVTTRRATRISLPAQTAAPTPIPAASLPTAGPVGPDTYPAGISPLTGFPAAAEALARVPAPIKISNFPAQGRPHAGLSYVDLVFEYFIGVGMTRFLAIP